MERVNKVPWWRCRRYWLATLLFLGFSLFCILRANLSIIIVCMVKHGRHDNTSIVTSYNTTNQSNVVIEETDTGNTCSKQLNSQEIRDEEGEFEWDKELQGILLGGYFWGYSSGFQILGGWLAQRYGTRKVITLGMLPLAIGNILSPVAIRISPYLFLVIRIISGLSTGVMFPAAPVFWSRWSPPDEWTRLLSSTNSGNELGNALGFTINGLLCSFGGWQLPFYVMGSLCFAWCVVWFVFARDSPSQMPGITEAEKNYIQRTIGNRMVSKRKYKTPWRGFFSSRAVWACIASHVTANFFLYMLLSQGPTFLSEVMNFDIKSNSLYSCLPYVVKFLLIMPVGWMADRFISRRYLSVKWVRRLMNTLGMFLPAVFLLALAYLPCSNKMAGVAMLTASIGTVAFCFSGHIVNMADIALQHAGILLGFSNTLASMPGIIAPYLVAYLTPQGTQEQWRTAFLIAIVMNIIGGVVFLLFSSGSPQEWAVPRDLLKTMVYQRPDKVLAEFTDLQNNTSNRDPPHLAEIEDEKEPLENTEGNELLQSDKDNESIEFALKTS